MLLRSKAAQRNLLIVLAGVVVLAVADAPGKGAGAGAGICPAGRGHNRADSLIAIPCFYLIANDAREKIYSYVSTWFSKS